MILTREKKENWTAIEKISFRVIFLYISLYIVALFSSPLWKSFVNWMATTVFHIDYDFSSNGRGSGDTTYAYVLLTCILLLTVIGSIVWSVLDRKRRSYNMLQYGFLVTLRFVLIFFMFTYGVVKVFHLQMPALSNADLIKTLGEKSPMGLAWTFMGFSKTYSVFAGLSEVIAGVLLIPRRTQTFGAAAVIVVMLNVFMMNLCFDIPVKIFSFHLMLMGVILLLADFKRVFGVLLFNRNIGTYKIYPILTKKERRIIRWVKGGLFLVLTWLFIFTSYPRYERLYVKPKTTFYGIWEVTSYQNKNTAIPSDSLQKKQWKYVAIDYKNSACIKTQDDKHQYFTFKVDTLQNTIAFGNRSTKELDTLQYTKTNTLISISGIIQKDSVNIELAPKNMDDFLLKSRGFNWINERPLNR